MQVHIRFNLLHLLRRCPKPPPGQNHDPIPKTRPGAAPQCRMSFVHQHGETTYSGEVSTSTTWPEWYNDLTRRSDSAPGVTCTSAWCNCLWRQGCFILDLPQRAHSSGPLLPQACMEDFGHIKQSAQYQLSNYCEMDRSMTQLCPTRDPRPTTSSLAPNEQT